MRCRLRLPHLTPVVRASLPAERHGISLRDLPEVAAVDQPAQAPDFQDRRSDPLLRRQVRDIADVLAPPNGPALPLRRQVDPALDRERRLHRAA